jgi:hypothetical protein
MKLNIVGNVRDATSGPALEKTPSTDRDSADTWAAPACCAARRRDITVTDA